jgi:hypothetical protein
MRLQNHLKNEDSFCSLMSKDTQVKFMTIHLNTQFDLVGVKLFKLLYLQGWVADFGFSLRIFYLQVQNSQIIVLLTEDKYAARKGTHNFVEDII